MEHERERKRRNGEYKKGRGQRLPKALGKERKKKYENGKGKLHNLLLFLFHLLFPPPFVTSAMNF